MNFREKIDRLVEFFAFRCKYAKTCPGYRKENYNCNQGTEYNCGIWKRLKIKEIEV